MRKIYVITLSRGAIQFGEVGVDREHQRQTADTWPDPVEGRYERSGPGVVR